MERLNWHMAAELSCVFDVTVVAPKGSRQLAPKSVAVIEVPLKPLRRFLAVSATRLMRFAFRRRPDVVIAGSGLTAPAALLAARSCGACAAVYVHGLDLAVPNFFYRRLWLPAIRRMDRVIANSGATADLAERLGVKSAGISIVHPGVELPREQPNALVASGFREQHGLDRRPILLSVGRLTERKGLREFVENILPMVIDDIPDAILVIIGDAPSDSLYAQSQTPASIRAAADEVGVGGAVKFLGVISDRRILASAYKAANVHVFPVRQLPGDPEGFGMVAVEAAAYGLQTVAFATGGTIDAVAHGRSGQLIPPGDSQTFANAVIHALRSPLPATLVREHSAQFTWCTFGCRLQAALRRA